MHWEKRICIRITIRRIVGFILAASTVVNLIVVGAVVAAESTPAPPTMISSPSMTSVLTNTMTPTVIFTYTATAEVTATPTVTPTYTLTATETLTDTPGPTPCMPRYDWPTYQIQPGNTLYWLASATGSTVQELMLANCLTSDRIYYGQMLHVPRLPINAFTPTPTATQTNTPTTPNYACDRAEMIADVVSPIGTVLLPGMPFIKTWRMKNTGSCTWTTSYSVVYMDGESFRAPLSTLLPVDVPPGGTIDISLNMIAPSVPGSYASSWMFRNASGMLFGIGEQGNLPWRVAIRVQDLTPTPGTTISFQNPSVCLGSNNQTNLYLAFAVSLSNVQDVSLVTAFSGQFIVVPLQDTGGGVYSGSVLGSGGYSPGTNVPYYFVVQDKSGQSIRSADYSSILDACGPL